jgi:hypothetical protein
MRTKLALIITTILVALTCTASAAADPQDYLNCGRPTTNVWDSYLTGHSWIGVWTGTDVARGGPGDGVWRLYAAAYTAGYYDGWHLSYYYWTSCYY